MTGKLLVSKINKGSGATEQQSLNSSQPCAHIKEIPIYEVNSMGNILNNVIPLYGDRC